MSVNLSALTFSIVSHGHAQMVSELLSQLDSNDSLYGSHVIVTVNCFEVFEIHIYKNILVKFIVNKHPLGFGANHNNAFKFCDTLWFIILNPDLKIIKDEPFTYAINSITSNSSCIGVLAPAVVNEFGILEDSARSNITPLSLIKRLLFGRVSEFSLDNKVIPDKFVWFAGMCLLFNASAFKAVDGFDERFFLYCEDYDICARLYNSGYVLQFVPSAIVEHGAQRDSHKSIKYLIWHLTSIFKVWTSSTFWKIYFK